MHMLVIQAIAFAFITVRGSQNFDKSQLLDIEDCLENGTYDPLNLECYDNAEHDPSKYLDLSDIDEISEAAARDNDEYRPFLIDYSRATIFDIPWTESPADSTLHTYSGYSRISADPPSDYQLPSPMQYYYTVPGQGMDVTPEKALKNQPQSSRTNEAYTSTLPQRSPAEEQLQLQLPNSPTTYITLQFGDEIKSNISQYVFQPGGGIAGDADYTVAGSTESRSVHVSEIGRRAKRRKISPTDAAPHNARASEQSKFSYETIYHQYQPPQYTENTGCRTTPKMNDFQYLWHNSIIPDYSRKPPSAAPLPTLKRNCPTEYRSFKPTPPQQASFNLDCVQSLSFTSESAAQTAAAINNIVSQGFNLFDILKRCDLECQSGTAILASFYLEMVFPYLYMFRVWYPNGYVFLPSPSETIVAYVLPKLIEYSDVDYLIALIKFLRRKAPSGLTLTADGKEALRAVVSKYSGYSNFVWFLDASKHRTCVDPLGGLLQPLPPFGDLQELLVSDKAKFAKICNELVKEGQYPYTVLRKLKLYHDGGYVSFLSFLMDKILSLLPCMNFKFDESITTMVNNFLGSKKLNKEGTVDLLIYYVQYAWSESFAHSGVAKSLYNVDRRFARVINQLPDHSIKDFILRSKDID